MIGDSHLKGKGDVMEGFLEGYRVLDLTDLRGHLCGRILGDMGADVVKIEPPGGDPSRNVGPFYHNEPDPEKGLNWFFANANKKGLTLNLETPEGRDIFKRLVARVDLVIESFEPKYLEDLGLGYASLCEIKPDIILTSITPFGQSGPYVGYKVTDIVEAAMGGMVYVFGDEDRAPVRISAPQAHFLGAQHGAVGAVTALYHRDMADEGQWVDVSTQEAVVFTLTYYLPTWEHLQVVRTRSGAYFTRPRLPPLGVLRTRWMFPCKDGYVAIAFQGGGGAPVKSSRAIVAWANDEGYARDIEDYKWETWDSSTIEQSQQDLLQAGIAPFLASRTKAQLLETAAERRILLAPVNTVADLPDNPQISHRDYWSSVFHPELNDTLTYPGPSVLVEQCPQKITRRAPTIGEHNREIYEGELGFSTEQIELLKAQGVI